MLLYLKLEQNISIVNHTDNLIAFKLGNMISFEMLFKQFYQPLVSYGFTIVRDRDEAEDVVQHIFVSLWEQRSELDIHTSLRAFLYKSVQNACLNVIKHKKVKRNFQEFQTYTSEFSSTQDQDLMAKELEMRINGIISNLPEQCARIFKMKRNEGMKYQEIANELGLSIKTVENQIGKALKVIRENLKDYVNLFVLFLIDQI